MLAVVGVLVGCCLTSSGRAQGKQLTTEDYARAEKFMAYNVNPLVYHGVARVSWMDDGRFWYRDNGPDGMTYMVVDPVKPTKTPAFDHAKLAAALTAASSGTEDPPGPPRRAPRADPGGTQADDGPRTLISGDRR